MSDKITLVAEETRDKSLSQLSTEASILLGTTAAGALYGNYRTTKASEEPLFLSKDSAQKFYEQKYSWTWTLERLAKMELDAQTYYNNLGDRESTIPKTITSHEQKAAYLAMQDQIDALHLIPNSSAKEHRGTQAAIGLFAEHWGIGNKLPNSITIDVAIAANSTLMRTLNTPNWHSTIDSILGYQSERYPQFTRADAETALKSTATTYRFDTTSKEFPIETLARERINSTSLSETASIVGKQLLTRPAILGYGLLGTAIGAYISYWPKSNRGK